MASSQRHGLSEGLELTEEPFKSGRIDRVGVLGNEYTEASAIRATFAVKKGVSVDATHATWRDTIQVQHLEQISNTTQGVFHRHFGEAIRPDFCHGRLVRVTNATGHDSLEGRTLLKPLVDQFLHGLAVSATLSVSAGAELVRTNKARSA